MRSLEAVRLPALMTLGSGSRELTVGVVDGPVDSSDERLATAVVTSLARPGTDDDSAHPASRHGTAIVSILAADRAAPSPGIAPGCTYLVCPIFSTAPMAAEPRATPAELADGIVRVVDHGARLINLSVAVVGAYAADHDALQEALDHAVRKGALVVAAAGNDAVVGGSQVARHPWVLPVVAYGEAGLIHPSSTTGRSIGLRGIGGPAQRWDSASGDAPADRVAGTSVATAIVTGALALLWSRYPEAPASAVRSAVVSSVPRARRAVPPLLDAWAACQVLSGGTDRRYC